MYAVDTAGATATAMVTTVVEVPVTVNAGGMFAPTACTTQLRFPADAVTVSVKSVPVVVAVPVVTLAVHELPLDPVLFDTVGDVPAAAPAAMVADKPFSEYVGT